MGNLLLLAYILLFSGTFFSLSYRGNAIREAFYGFEAASLESSISIRNTRSELSHIGPYVDPYFVKERVSSFLSLHFESAFEKLAFAPNYKLELAYSNYQAYMDLKNRFISDYPQKLTVSFECPFFPDNSFKGSRSFLIEKGVPYAA